MNKRGGRQHRGSIEDMKHHLGELGNYVIASQRRAQEYENLKNGQQEVLEELNRLKQAKSQDRYRDDDRIRGL